MLWSDGRQLTVLPRLQRPGTIKLTEFLSVVLNQRTVVGLLRERVTKLFQQIEMNETLVCSLKY